MDRFVRRQNLEHFRKKLAETKDEPTRRMLLALLAEEEAKEASPPKAK